MSHKLYDSGEWVNNLPATSKQWYFVEYFYLATGMEGMPDVEHYGWVEADSNAEAKAHVITQESIKDNKQDDKDYLFWMNSCVSASTEQEILDCNKPKAVSKDGVLYSGVGQAASIKCSLGVTPAFLLVKRSGNKIESMSAADGAW